MGPSPQLLSPALGPGRQRCRDTARMSKPVSSVRAAGRSLLLPAWPGTALAQRRLLAAMCCKGTTHPLGLVLNGGSLGHLCPP